MSSVQAKFNELRAGVPAVSVHVVRRFPGDADGDLERYAIERATYAPGFIKLVVVGGKHEICIEPSSMVVVGQLVLEGHALVHYHAASKDAWDAREKEMAARKAGAAALRK